MQKIPESKLVVSISQQTAKLFTGKKIKEFKVSTGRGGIGSEPDSNATPIGKFEVNKEIGEGLPPTIGIKGASVTSLVNKKDPIIGRSIWISGLEPHNKNTLKRTIRLHGTPRVDCLGKPVSMGCVRFNPIDIALVCNYIQPGDKITIQP